AFASTPRSTRLRRVQPTLGSVHGEAPAPRKDVGASSCVSQLPAQSRGSRGDDFLNSTPSAIGNHSMSSRHRDQSFVLALCLNAAASLERMYMVTYQLSPDEFDHQTLKTLNQAVTDIRDVLEARGLCCEGLRTDEF